MTEGWVQAAVAANDYEAHLMSGRLEEEGIEVVLEPFATGAAAYLHPGGDPSAPVRILVPTEDGERATATLESFDGTVEVDEIDLAAEDEAEVPENEIFAQRRAGIPMKILVAVAVVAAIILGLVVAVLDSMDL
jgi:hypothetical protein